MPYIWKTEYEADDNWFDTEAEAIAYAETNDDCQRVTKWSRYQDDSDVIWEREDG